MSEKPKHVKRNSSTTSVQWVVSTMNGSRLPDSVFEKLDKAIQRAMDDSKVRLVASVVRA